MSRIILPESRPPLYIGAGILKEEGQLSHIAEDENIAAIIAGSFTDPEWFGNDDGGRKNVEYWDGINLAYYNSIGLKNPGRKGASLYLPESLKRIKDNGMLAFLSVTTLKGDDPTKVLPDMVEWGLEMGADGVEVNGSCPNEDPDHPLLCQDIDATGRAITAIRDRVGKEACLGYKVSPMETSVIEKYGRTRMEWDFYDVTNTKGNQLSPTNPATGRPYIEVNNGLAGMSGPIITRLSADNLEEWVANVEGHADVLSMGGVDSLHSHPNEIYLRINRLGALMVGGAQEFRRAKDVRQVTARWAEHYVQSAGEFN